MDPSVWDYHSCEFCRAIVIDHSNKIDPATGDQLENPDEDNRDKWYLVGPNLQSLLDAKDSCLFAAKLVSWFSDPQLLESPSRWKLFAAYDPYLCEFYHLPGLWIHGLWAPGQGYKASKGRYIPKCILSPEGDGFEFVTTRDDPASGFYKSAIDPNPASPETFTLARKWLSECLITHETCKKPSSNFMPRVLLRVCQGANQSYRIRLELPAPGTSKPYLALSYCWGGDQTYKTTRARMESRDFELVWDMLPSSIQDAIIVTLSLGHDLLWVDSLCIVQDDESDKAQQIAMMPDVFANATLTIMASRADSSTDGFLGPVNKDLGLEPFVKLRFLPSGPERMKSDVKDEGTVYASIGELRDYAEPIDERGWTFQERYLSTRILEYKSRQVRWICQSCLGPQNDNRRNSHLTNGWSYYSNSKERSIFLATSKLLKSLPVSQPSPELLDNDMGDLHRFYRLVVSYCERFLSYPQDRILAISGIAEVLRSKLGSEYLAGLWKETLPVALLWFARAPQPQPTRYLAPSWSWAAINGRVNYDFVFPWRFQRLYMSVTNVEGSVDLVDKTAPCGAVHSGRITGLGKIRKVCWDGRHVRDTCTGQQFAASNEYLSRLDIYPDFSDLLTPPVKHSASRGFSGLSSRECHDPCIDLYLLLIADDRLRTGTLHHVIGLVLQALESQHPEASGDCSAAGNTTRHYRRVGFFTTSETTAVEGTKKECFDSCKFEDFEII